MKYLTKAIPLIITIAVIIWLISEQGTWNLEIVLAAIILSALFIIAAANPLIDHIKKQKPYRKSKALREKDHITIATTKEGLLKQCEQGYLVRKEYIVALVEMDIPADELFETYEQDYITRDEYIDIASGFIELRDWNEEEGWSSKKKAQKKSRKWDLRWRKAKIEHCLSVYEENRATREEYLYAVRMFKNEWQQDDRKYFLKTNIQ